MGKALFIAEKPSVAKEFVSVLKVKGTNGNGYIEGDKAVFTWCVGHLVNMSYPEAYDESLKRWSLSTLPFIPNDFKYEVIPSAAKQFNVVKKLMLRDDIDTIYVCTDSGREGEYIYRLVDMMVGAKGKVKKRIWIDSQTEEEIKRGIKEAKDLSEYDSLSDSAYLRAKEDFLVGINFSRLLTLLYGNVLKEVVGKKSVVVAVGRVMTCVLAMIVEREREIRNFKETNFYKVNGTFKVSDESLFEGGWKVVERSEYFNSPKLYNETGFLKEEDARTLIKDISMNKQDGKVIGIIEKVTKKNENKNAPLLFNLAELQNECSKIFKINPDQTLGYVQGMYEKKMLTYPRTDARVLSTAVAKEVHKNVQKLQKFIWDSDIQNFAKNIMENGLYKGIEKKKYVDDKKITDHYAIIPTGEGLGNYDKLSKIEKGIYNIILRRFLAIFYDAAKYKKVEVEIKVENEMFFTSNKVLVEKGYLEVLQSYKKEKSSTNEQSKEDTEEVDEKDTIDLSFLATLKKGQKVELSHAEVKEGKTSPPKRYSTGSMILAMENAGKIIEDEELREHIKGSGIGTSATRAEILKKLVEKDYVKLNEKTQILTPAVTGELVYDCVMDSVPSLSNPILTASWEKGLKLVVDKEITSDNFMKKLEDYIVKNTNKALQKSGVIDVQRVFSSTLKENDISVDENTENNVLGVCPICKKGHVVKNKKGYGCTNWSNGCKFFVATIAGKTIPLKELKNLIQYGKTSVISGFKSKKGSEFSAGLIIKGGKIEFYF